MPKHIADEEFFAKLSAADEAAPPGGVRAPARLKSRVYSALIRCQEESGALLGLSETRVRGCKLCVFESFVQIAPLGEQIKTFNLCRVCHARLLGETLEHAPIYWRHCPYVSFQGR